LHVKTILCPDRKKTMDVRKMGAEKSVGSKVEEVTEGCIKQHNELNDLYFHQILLQW
jgi:hypothetical protein